MSDVKLSSLFDELIGKSIGFPTFIVTRLKYGTKNLNLTNLCELINAMGNNK